uniref:ND6 CDS n=1 Tax=Olavius algarvensis TaxID=188229 RepID=A0A7R9NFZ8_9ANNE|nr:ND6 CDS [Olavius algarvensis]
MMWFLLLMITTMMWSMLSHNNPMSLSMIIMMIATMVSIIISLNLSSWYAMILFLIYVGGLLVMFSYFVSLSSNDPMMLKSKMHFIIMPTILYKSLNLQMSSNLYNNSQMNMLYKPMNMITMLLITMALLVMMIIVIKMVKSNNGPLRGFNQL